MNINIMPWLFEKIKWFIGGGTAKYRVKGLFVEMKGGGTGPFWGFAHFRDFDTTEQAEILARKWAKDAGGLYCGIYVPKVRR